MWLLENARQLLACLFLFLFRKCQYLVLGFSIIEILYCGTWWRIDWVDAFCPKGNEWMNELEILWHVKILSFCR